MVTQHLSVVGGKENPGIFKETVFSQRTEQPAELVIHLGDAGIVCPAAGCNLFGTEEMHICIFVGTGQKALGGVFEGVGPVSVYRFWHGNLLVQFPEITAGIERWMRLCEAGPQKERAQGISGLDKINGFIPDPGGHAVPDLHRGNHRLHEAFTDAVDLGPYPVAPFVTGAHVVQRQGHMLEAVAGPGRLKMHLSFCTCLITGVRKHGGKCQPLCCPRFHKCSVVRVGYNAAFVSLDSRHDGGPGGDTDRA